MDAVSLYNDGYGTTEIASILGCHRSTVQRTLLNRGLSLRKKTPKTHYNVNSFKSITCESCYWAGFIAADGNIRSDRNTVQIHLSIIDYDHLLKFKEFINFNGNIEVNDTSCRITVSGEWFVKDLRENFNITPKKSLTLVPPELPYHLIRHYLRGYFDGDGSITKTSVPSMSIVGTKETLNVFNQHIGVLVKLKSGNTTAPLISTGNVFQISYSGLNAYKILNHLYSETDIYLSRKKIKFDQLFSSYKHNPEVCDG